MVMESKMEEPIVAAGRARDPGGSWGYLRMPRRRLIIPLVLTQNDHDNDARLSLVDMVALLIVSAHDRCIFGHGQLQDACTADQ